MNATKPTAKAATVCPKCKGTGRLTYWAAQCRKAKMKCAACGGSGK